MVRNKRINYQKILNISKKDLIRKGIYLVKNKINGKVYIGSTNVSFLRRFYSHFVDKSFSMPIKRAFIKYGIENFEYSILEFTDNLSKNEIEQKELYWITKYNSTDRKIGYNIVKDPRRFSPIYEKPVIRIDIITKEVKNYDSILKASLDINLCAGGIIMSCKSILKDKYTYTTNNKKFYWMYKKDFDMYGIKNPNLRQERKGQQKSIIQYDLYNNIIKYWDSLFEIKEVLGFDCSNITKCCRNKTHSSYGYVWRYNNKRMKELLLEPEYLDTTDGESISCISVENLNGFLDKIKKQYPNDADLGEYIRNLKINEE